MENKNKLIKYFKNDKFVLKNGISIVEANAEYALCKAEITQEHLNSENIVQGGMIYTLADFAFAVLSNYLHKKVVSQTATITYLRAGLNCKTIFAKAREVNTSRRNCIHQVIVYDQSDNVLAIMQMNGFIFNS